VRSFNTNINRHIERVIAAQGLGRADAADQVGCRIYDARQYLQRRAVRAGEVA